jgi:hypothetical protein
VYDILYHEHRNVPEYQSELPGDIAVRAEQRDQWRKVTDAAFFEGYGMKCTRGGVLKPCTDKPCAALKGHHRVLSCRAHLPSKKETN